MECIVQETPDTFRTDLAGLSRLHDPRAATLGGKLAGLLRGMVPRTFVVDPFVVCRAVLGVMERCDFRSPSGVPLVWNEYMVFLARVDHDRLRPLEAILQQEMEPLLYQQVQRMKGDTVGPLTVHVLVDEGGDLESGIARIRVVFAPVVASRPLGDGEITIRLGEGTDHTVVPPGSSTERLPDPVQDPGLAGRSPDAWVTWSGGRHPLYVGNRVTLGRPNPDPLGSFVPLEGAGPRVSRRQVWLELSPEGLLVGRLQDANPVQVDGVLLQPGGNMLVERLPVTLDLSSGALRVTVERGPTAP